MEEDHLKGETFVNATGKTIPQIFINLDYTVPGKVYKPPMPNGKSNHSLFHYVKQLLSSVISSKFKQFVSSISLDSKKTLQSTYS